MTVSKDSANRVLAKVSSTVPQSPIVSHSKTLVVNIEIVLKKLKNYSGAPKKLLGMPKPLLWSSHCPSLLRRIASNNLMKSSFNKLLCLVIPLLSEIIDFD